MSVAPPRILIVDDLFGRICADQTNRERANLCGQFLLIDESEDEASRSSRQRIVSPVARAVFWRGQKPRQSRIGDVVENDLDGVLAKVASGWASGSTDRWAMVLLDLCFYTGPITAASDSKARGMPEGRPGDDDPKQYFGLRILEAFQQRFPRLPVAILSSKSRDEVSREFSSLGALGFVPRDVADGPTVLKDFLWWHGLLTDDADEVLGSSKALLWALRAARRAARSQRNLLIRGERGSGKELLGRYIHRQSPDSSRRPFVTVNSAVLTAELFGSELFGIERGVATGVDARTGLLRAASGGDLFFDEIKDMVPQVQAGILRALERQLVSAVGGTAEHAVDARFLSATNEDIESLAGSGAFRADLLDRLREGGTIYLPPLRERLDDLPLLTERFVRAAEAENPRALRRSIDPDAIGLLQSHDWPGNVRELRSVLFAAVSDYPDVEHLVPIHIRLRRQAGDEALIPAATRGLSAESHASTRPLSDLLRELSEHHFDARRGELLMGSYARIQPAFGTLSGRALRAALEATRRVTAATPHGEISIQAALRLLTGDESLTAWKAADLIKRIMDASASDSELQNDTVLQTAYEAALRLRPRNKKTTLSEG